MSKTLRRWSPQEDSILQQEVEVQITANHGTVQDWNIIAQKIEGRSNKDCRKRFYNGITEGLKKGPWSTEEDQLLERLVNKYGPTWAVIAREIETRSADQCSKRWQHCLDPELDRSCWSTEDNIALINAVKTHESAWKDIQTLHFPSRSANNVKNQYSVLRRHNIQVSQDTPPCCTTEVERSRNVSRNESTIAHVPNESSMVSGHFGNEMESIFDGLTDTNHRDPEFAHDFSYPSPEGDSPFQPLAVGGQPLAMTPESMNYDFGPFAPRGGSNTIIVGRQPSSNQPMATDINHETLDFHMQNTMTTSLSYPPTQSIESSNLRLNSTADASPSNPGGIHSVGDAIEWPSVFDAGPIANQQQKPSSGGTNILSSPPTPNMQTTIRLEGADPSTVSAVISVLIESKAKFKFETH